MDKITISEAMGYLIPLMGSGGLGAIIAAYFGYKRGREEKRDPMLAVATMYADRITFERVAAAISDLARAFTATAEAQRDSADAQRNNTDAMKDLARAYELRARRARD